MPVFRFTQRYGPRPPPQTTRPLYHRMPNRPPPPSITRMRILQPPSFQNTSTTLYQEEGENEGVMESLEEYALKTQYDERRKQARPLPVQRPTFHPPQQSYLKKLSALFFAQPVRYAVAKPPSYAYSMR